MNVIRYLFLQPALLAGPLYFALTACAPMPHRPDSGHIDVARSTKQGIPATVQHVPMLEPPRPLAAQETYSVVVTDVPVKDMLFALARDAKLNVDIHPNVTGNVTLNAINQTLPQILDRITRQVSVRFTQNGNSLEVEADTPFLRNYKVDYVNMSRDNTSEVSVATQIATTGASATDAASGGGSGNNNSTTRVVSTSNQRFWSTLEHNVRAIIGEASAKDEASSTVIVNAESGTLTVRATTLQHQQVQAFLDQVLASAQRQVMIEATVVEVNLNDTYKLGVDWNVIANSAGLSVDQSLLGKSLSQSPFSVLTYADSQTNQGNVTATLGMLRQFGDVKVLSSPKIMAINNQTALLKVVDNLVYFTIQADTTTTTTGPSTTTFTTTVHTVPVGFVMSVTPQINDTDTVILNVRPTISRVISYVRDPNPSLANSNVESNVPQIQVREMDSLLRINSGQTAVLGGLIQDNVDLNKSGTPFLSEVPHLGDLFSYRNNVINRTELVIFLRPRVIRDPGVDGELADYRRYLPENQHISSDPERLTGGGT